MINHFEVLKNQISDNFYQEECIYKLAEVIEIFLHYYKEYEKAFGSSHPFTDSAAIQEIIKNISLIAYKHMLDCDKWSTMIDYYFSEKRLHCGYTVAEFAELKTLEELYYKSVYADADGETGIF